MPETKTYKITAPDNRVFNITADHPPTQEELQTIFKTLPAKTQTKEEQLEQMEKSGADPNAESWWDRPGFREAYYEKGKPPIINPKTGGYYYKPATSRSEQLKDAVVEATSLAGNIFAPQLTAIPKIKAGLDVVGRWATPVAKYGLGIAGGAGGQLTGEAITDREMNPAQAALNAAIAETFGTVMGGVQRGIQNFDSVVRAAYGKIPIDKLPEGFGRWISEKYGPELTDSVRNPLAKSGIVTMDETAALLEKEGYSAYPGQVSKNPESALMAALDARKSKSVIAKQEWLTEKKAKELGAGKTKTEIAKEAASTFSSRHDQLTNEVAEREAQVFGPIRTGKASIWTKKAEEITKHKDIIDVRDTVNRAKTIRDRIDELIGGIGIKAKAGEKQSSAIGEAYRETRNLVDSVITDMESALGSEKNLKSGKYSTIDSIMETSDIIEDRIQKLKASDDLVDHKQADILEQFNFAIKQDIRKQVVAKADAAMIEANKAAIDQKIKELPVSTKSKTKIAEYERKVQELEKQKAAAAGLNDAQRRAKINEFDDWWKSRDRLKEIDRSDITKILKGGEGNLYDRGVAAITGDNPKAFDTFVNVAGKEATQNIMLMDMQNKALHPETGSFNPNVIRQYYTDQADKIQKVFGPDVKDKARDFLTLAQVNWDQRNIITQYPLAKSYVAKQIVFTLPWVGPWALGKAFGAEGDTLGTGALMAGATRIGYFVLLNKRVVSRLVNNKDFLNYSIQMQKAQAPREREYYGKLMLGQVAKLGLYYTLLDTDGKAKTISAREHKKLMETNQQTSP